MGIFAIKIRNRSGKIMIGLLAISFLLGGCASGRSLWDRFFGEEEDRTAAELMSEGTERMERGSYEAAAEAFQKLKERYPYSQYAILAELKMADALYKKKEYDAAFDAYDEFERLHPKNKDISYVIYQKGMCHFKQITTIDRDQTHTLKANEEFERLVKRFPREEYAHKARRNIRKCLIYLAEHELYVGHYYYKKGNYQAAMERYTSIIKSYPDMGQYNEALDYISRCKEKLSREEKKQTP